MKLYQGLAALIILLRIDSCTGVCSEYPQFRRCKAIIDAFEQAVLEQDSNVFALNAVFNPANRYPAPSIFIAYVLFLPPQESGIKVQVKAKIRGWCKSNAHTIASPFMLQTLFTGLTYAYNTVISRQRQTHMNLALNLTRYYFTEEEIDYAINYITPWVSFDKIKCTDNLYHTITQLKLYASKEDWASATVYKDEEKGYMCDIVGYNWYLTLSTAIVTIATICISSKVLHLLLYTNSKKADLKMAFFCTFGFIVYIVNFTDIGTLIHEAVIYFNNEINIDENSTLFNEKDKLTINTAHRVTKLLEIVIGVLVFIIGGLVCSKYHPVYLRIQKRCFYCYFVYFFSFGSFFYFTYTIGLNIVPTFMMLFIAPIETISVVFFFSTQLTSAVMGMAIVIHFKKYGGKKRERKKLNLCIAVSPIFLYLSVLFFAVTLMAIFLAILSRVHTNNTSYLAPVFLTLGSTIPTILIGYVSKRTLNNNTQDNDNSSMELGNRSTDEEDSVISKTESDYMKVTKM